MKAAAFWRAMAAVARREVVRFSQQRARLLSAVVRPSLWLLVFAPGFAGLAAVSTSPPYSGLTLTYQQYIVPGLLGMVLLFNGMQSSLSMVYDREMGIMRLLLTAPLPRWFLLLCKLAAGTLLSILQAYAFLIVCWLAGVALPWWGWLSVLPSLLLGGLMLGAMGLLLSVYIRQLENFAGAMNFVIFPMFFLSTALYPLAVKTAHHAVVITWLARLNPFEYGVALIRFALYGQVNVLAAVVVVTCLAAFFALAVLGYDPQRGMVRRIRRG